MPNLKARLLGGWLGDRLLRDSVVESTEELGPRFRRVVLRASWAKELTGAAGEKVQLFLPEVGTRTYTPFDFDRAAGRFSVLVFLHADTPGPSFARALTVGAEVRLIGPQASTPLDGLEGPVSLFGDETSFAVARTLREIARLREASLVRFEVSSPEEAFPAVDALDLPREALVRKEPEEAHLRGIAEALTGSIVLTGRASSIQKVREHLRAAGRRKQLVRAYWADGKTGLD
jgi:NADPH-dependent ferric siderophore reductase